MTDNRIEENSDLYEHSLEELTDEELKSLKNARLNYTVNFVYHNNSFYRQVMEEKSLTPSDFKTTEDLKKLPVIDSDTLRQNQPPFSDENEFKSEDTNVKRPFSTSGTSGVPKKVLKSFDEMERIYDDLKRGHESYGVTSEDVILNWFPFVGLNPSGAYTEGWIERLGAMSLPLLNTDYPTDYETALLKQYSPDVITGLASHVDAKGRAFEHLEGFDPKEIGVDIITLSGEPVTKNRKEHISKVFGSEVYDFLASTETGGIAYECPEGNHYHILDDSVHVEVLDGGYNRLDEGEEGKLVVTNLLHPGEESSMPLLRYNMGDIVSKYFENSGDCECSISGVTNISAPKREAWEFIIGAVNLNAKYIEDKVYENEEIKEVVEGYQVRLDYDEKEGDVMNILLETKDDHYLGDKTEGVSLSDSSRSPSYEVGRKILDGDQYLKDTVENVGAAKINVEFVEGINMPPGKPERIVDNR